MIYSNWKEYAPNRTLAQEGSRGDSMILLVKGEADTRPRSVHPSVETSHSTNKSAIS